MATLLIVDDDTSIRETLHELLSETNECHTADRAEQALAYLEIESYDAVLTDISMPGLSGREILKRIQEKHSTTPVIVISGNSNTGAVAELLAMGAFAYLTKPFQLTEVEDTVNRAITLRQELLEAAKKENAGADPDQTLSAESAESS